MAIDFLACIPSKVTRSCFSFGEYLCLSGSNSVHCPVHIERIHPSGGDNLYRPNFLAPAFFPDGFRDNKRPFSFFLKFYPSSGTPRSMLPLLAACVNSMTPRFNCVLPHDCAGGIQILDKDSFPFCTWQGAERLFRSRRHIQPIRADSKQRKSLFDIRRSSFGSIGKYSDSHVGIPAAFRDCRNCLANLLVGEVSHFSHAGR